MTTVDPHIITLGNAPYVVNIEVADLRLKRNALSISEDLKARIGAVEVRSARKNDRAKTPLTSLIAQLLEFKGNEVFVTVITQTDAGSYVVQEFTGSTPSQGRDQLIGNYADLTAHLAQRTSKIFFVLSAEVGAGLIATLSRDLPQCQFETLSLTQTEPLPRFEKAYLMRAHRLAIGLASIAVFGCAGLFGLGYYRASQEQSHQEIITTTYHGVDWPTFIDTCLIEFETPEKRVGGYYISSRTCGVVNTGSAPAGLRTNTYELSSEFNDKIARNVAIRVFRGEEENIDLHERTMHVKKSFDVSEHQIDALIPGLPTPRIQSHIEERLLERVLRTEITGEGVRAHLEGSLKQVFESFELPEGVAVVSLREQVLGNDITSVLDLIPDEGRSENIVKKVFQ